VHSTEQLTTALAGGIPRGYSVSHDGLLVEHDASGSFANNAVVIESMAKGVDTVRLPPGRYATPRFSRDGKRIAMAVGVSDRASPDIYTLDLAAGAFTRITFDGVNTNPAWSPDGRTLAYVKSTQDSTHDGVRDAFDVFVKPADNSGPERRITSIVSAQIGLQQWIDDTHVLFSARVGTGAYDVFVASTDGNSKPVAYMQTPRNETEPRLSPDGTLLAYVADETGRNELWMGNFPAPRGKWNLSNGPAHAPRWTPDGKAILFWRGTIGTDSLFRVRIDRTPAIVIHAPELVTTLAKDGLSNWDLQPDGRRFVASVKLGDAATGRAPGDRYLIVENWFSELRRLTSGRGK
jgi:dipeptidyl aminopeptidase/acylaminoacyl peptidase